MRLLPYYYPWNVEVFWKGHFFLEKQHIFWLKMVVFTREIEDVTFWQLFWLFEGFRIASEKGGRLRSLLVTVTWLVWSRIEGVPPLEGSRLNLQFTTEGQAPLPAGSPLRSFPLRGPLPSGTYPDTQRPCSGLPPGRTLDPFEETRTARMEDLSFMLLRLFLESKRPDPFQSGYLKRR